MICTWQSLDLNAVKYHQPNVISNKSKINMLVCSRYIHWITCNAIRSNEKSTLKMPGAYLVCEEGDRSAVYWCHPILAFKH